MSSVEFAREKLASFKRFISKDVEPLVPPEKKAVLADMLKLLDACADSLLYLGALRLALGKIEPADYVRGKKVELGLTEVPEHVESKFVNYYTCLREILSC